MEIIKKKKTIYRRQSQLSTLGANKLVLVNLKTF
jgi:hypothetical protein